MSKGKRRAKILDHRLFREQVAKEGAYEVVVPDKDVEQTWHVYVFGPATWRYRAWIKNHGFDWQPEHRCFVRHWIPTKLMAEQLTDHLKDGSSGRLAVEMGKGEFHGIDLTKDHLSPPAQDAKEESLSAWSQLAERYRERMLKLELTDSIDEDEKNVWQGLICVLEDPTSRVAERQRAVETLGKMTGVLTRRAEQIERDEGSAKDASLEDLLEKTGGEESVDS